MPRRRRIQEEENNEEEQEPQIPVQIDMSGEHGEREEILCPITRDMYPKESFDLYRVPCCKSLIPIVPLCRWLDYSKIPTCPLCRQQLSYPNHHLHFKGSDEEEGNEEENNELARQLLAADFYEEGEIKDEGEEEEEENDTDSSTASSYLSELGDYDLRRYNVDEDSDNSRYRKSRPRRRYVQTSHSSDYDSDTW